MNRRPDVVVIVASLTVFTVCAVIAADGRVGPVERDLFHAVNELPDWLYRPMLAFQYLGVLAMPLIVAAGALVFRRWRLAAALVLVVPLKLATQRLVAAQRIQGASAGGGGEPGTRVGGDAALGPAGEGSDEGVLDALLGNIEITGQAHRRGQHERPLATVRLGQRPPDLGRRLADLVHAVGGAPEVSMIGRSSTPPPGAGHSLANAKAWSRSAASIR
jgi:hypothetical protein